MKTSYPKSPPILITPLLTPPRPLTTLHSPTPPPSPRPTPLTSTSITHTHPHPPPPTTYPQPPNYRQPPNYQQPNYRLPPTINLPTITNRPSTVTHHEEDHPRRTPTESRLRQLRLPHTHNRTRLHRLSYPTHPTTYPLVRLLDPSLPSNHQPDLPTPVSLLHFLCFTFSLLSFQYRPLLVSLLPGEEPVDVGQKVEETKADARQRQGILRLTTLLDKERCL